MRRGALLAALVGALLLVASCGAGSREPASGALRVFVGILPHQYVVDRIGGSRVAAESLVQPGQDPHTFEPMPRQVAGLSDARLYFRVGMGFEDALVARMSAMSALRVVDTREGITLVPMEDEHEEHGLDPHVWMDPALLRRQAQTIRDALIAVDPEGRSAYQAGYQSLAADLEALRGEVAAALAPYRGKELFVFHPAFGYFARAFGLAQVAVETGGKEPSARELARLIDQAKARGVRVVFVQPQFSQAGARAIAEAIGGAVVPIDDLAYDYLANLRLVAGKVAAVLADGKETP
jgi:zinc transport system substrate-binding protein